MKTILFANARDETNILEWIVHHLNLGFTHIYLFDHKSIVPLTDVLKNVPKDLLTIHRIDSDIRKANLIYDAHKIALSMEYDWMLYLDVDEFLVLNNKDTVQEFLLCYNQFDQVGVNWLLFGSNYLDAVLGDDETIIESYLRCEGKLDRHIKSFLNLKNKSIMLKNPHVYFLPDMSHSINVNYAVLEAQHPYWFHTNAHYNNVSAYIAHYTYQSYDTYISRKINVPRDDTGSYRTLLSKEQIHGLYNNVENLVPLNKYNAANKVKIDLYKV